MKELTSILLLFVLSIVLINDVKAIKEWWEETKAVELTTENFKTIVGKEKYVVVKFYTKWCKYCKLLAPIYDELVEFLKTKDVNDVIIARLEANTNQEISMTYGVFSFPTIVFFTKNNPRPQDVFQGERSVESFWSWLRRNVPPKKRNERFSSKNDVVVKKVEPITVSHPTKVDLPPPVELITKVNKTSDIKLHHIDLKNNTDRINKINLIIDNLERDLVTSEGMLNIIKREILSQKEKQKTFSKKALMIIIILIILILVLFFKCILGDSKKTENFHHN